MLALYLLTQLPYMQRELFLKANLEHLLAYCRPLSSLRISIICLRQEQRVIKIQSSIDHLAFFLFPVFFFLLSSLQQLLSAEPFVCFLFLLQQWQLLSWLFFFFSTSMAWRAPQMVFVMRGKACLPWHLLSCLGGTNARSWFWLLRGRMTSRSFITLINYHKLKVPSDPWSHLRIFWLSFF